VSVEVEQIVQPEHLRLWSSIGGSPWKICVKFVPTSEKKT